MSALDNNEISTSQSEDDPSDPLLALFQTLKTDIRDAEQVREDWRKDAKDWYNMVAGHQWDEEDENLLRKQHRPPVSFNRVAPMVKAVCGLEVNNRQSIAYLPRQVGFSGPSEMITATGQWVRDECYAEDEESEAFRDCAICGEGWTETRMDFDEDPMGKIVKERIDPLEMGVNKGAFRANYVDARMIYRIREMDPDDVRALLNLPTSVLDEALDARWLPNTTTPIDGGKGNKRDYPNKTRAGLNGRTGPRKTVTIVQCQYWVREPVHVVATPNDQEPQMMSPDDFAKFKERADQINALADQQDAGMAALANPQPAPRIDYTAAQTTRKVYYQCFIGNQILDHEPLQMGLFQFSAMTGDRDKKKKYFYGMVKDMMDPQRWSNKFLSQTMHHVNVNAKGGLLAETDAFTNVKKAETDWADPTKIVWVKPGSLSKQKVKERTPIPLPPGLDALMTFAISSIRDVTGINLELLGQADREQAAILEQQRRQSAMTILATMFDSLRKYRKRDGKLLLHFIWLLPENTLVRVVDQGQTQYIPLIKQGLDLEKFDIIIDQAPSSPDQKQYIWSITAQILQMNILPAPAIIELLKYSPYPETVVQEIRNALGLDGQMPPDMLQQKLAQAEQALQVLENELKQALTAAHSKETQENLDTLRLKIEEYKAQTDRLNAEWQARVKLATSVVSAHASGASAGGASAAGGAPSSAPPVGDPNFDQLPDLSTIGGDLGTGAPASGAQPSPLEQKVDQLANMMQQLISNLQPQVGAVPPPPADSAQEQQ